MGVVILKEKPYCIEFPHVGHPMGDLFFCQKDLPLPFDLKRVYFVAGIPAEARRGGHSHRKGIDILVALVGAVTVLLFDEGGRRLYFRLDSPRYGILIPQNWWVELRDYAPNSVTLVVSSIEFHEGNYIRNPEEFFTGAIPDDVISRSEI